MIKIHLSRVLGEIRMTQVELARCTGIRAATICELYNDFATRLNTEHLDKICEATGCTMSDLLEYVPNEKRHTGKDLILEEHGNRKSENL